jgi:hypothetical protein
MAPSLRELVWNLADVWRLSSFPKTELLSSMSELGWEQSIFAIFFPRKPCYACWKLLPPLCVKSLTTVSGMAGLLPFQTSPKHLDVRLCLVSEIRHEG